jgi:DNA invertase Pin-like site-specific DNA recombinase
MARRYSEHRIVAYSRVSTDEQADSGLGLAAQRSTLEAEVARRGIPAEWVSDAGYSGKSLHRPGIERALADLSAGLADVLLVAKLDRLTRSLFDLAGLMERARREHWALVALDLAVDTASPAGEAMTAMLGTFAQFERRLIGQRTKDALRIKRDQGVRLGRPVVTAPEVSARIARLREEGQSLAAIATVLNGEAVPTSHGGGRWWASSVQSVLSSQRRQQPPTR